MMVAVQANLVQLKVADARRRGIEPGSHEIDVPSPGPVSRFREMLVDRGDIADYTDQALRLRLHEVWGQYCLFQWVLGEGDGAMRCETSMAAKQAEIHAVLWRLRFEQRSREKPDCADSPSLAVDVRLAAEIPAVVFGSPVRDASDEAVLLGACEHAGMLAAIRWCADRTRRWGEEGIMDVADRPF